MRRIEQGFPATPQAVTQARHLAQQTLSDSGLQSDEVLMVVNELAANAVSHVGEDFVLALSTTPDHVTVEVHDPSPVEPVVRAATDWASGGRGLLLVSALAPRWGIEHLPDNSKRVWAEVRLAPA